VPENIITTLIGIFDQINDGNGTISVNNLKQRINLDGHPRIKLMQKTKEEIISELDFSINFVAGDKEYLELNDFLEFHRNMYWVQPKENLSNFYNVSIFLYLFSLYMIYGKLRSNKVI
jgi:hypothetical protein